MLLGHLRQVKSPNNKQPVAHNAAQPVLEDEMKNFERNSIVAAAVLATVAFVILTIIDFRELDRKGETVAGPMNYEKPTAPLSSVSVVMTSTGGMRTGRTSGLVLGGRCDCAFEGQKIMTDDGPGFCFDGVAVKEEAYKKLSVDPKFKYTKCDDPRSRDVDKIADECQVHGVPGKTTIIIDGGIVYQQ
ncbi:MAG: hypothetical protein PHC53_02795 [Patescibacteria group bacterium]|nr:hypothetical protein [Patescibacteria group bacterium]